MKKLFNAMGDHLVGDLDRVGGSGLTRLQQAVVDDDPKRVSSLIGLKANLNHAGLNGEPPLHRALATNRSAIARLLIEAGADVNLPDARGQTPLHKATLQGNAAMVKMLLDHGADPELADREGRTAMHMAPPGCDDCVVLLARHGGDVNRADNQGRRPLHYYLKQERMTACLLSLGADPNAGGAPASPYAIALSVPLVSSHPTVIALLLRGGADINAPAINGERLLHVAARTGQSALFRAAIETADITLCDQAGNTVLHALMELPQPDHIKMILTRDPAMASRRNKDGYTPMELLVTAFVAAPAHGADTHVNTLGVIARQFLVAGADPSAAGHGGTTLLHEAVARNRVDLIDALARHGADLDRKDRRGTAALQLAVDMRRIDLVDRLLDHGADPDLIDDRGWTLLDRLAEKKDRDSPVVQRLIVAGGQYNKQLPLYPDLIRPRKSNDAPAAANDDRLTMAPRPDKSRQADESAAIVRKPRPPAPK